MKKIFLTAFALTLAAGMSAQSAIDAYLLSQNDLRGTARFMSMGGAFGALGGDLSTLNQNPAGIGIYRSSEIGLTLNLDFQSSDVDGATSSMTKFMCPNFGYIGSINLNSSIMPYFQWGASYSRKASFDRVYKGGFPALGTSMSNYVAYFTDGMAPETLLDQGTNYPYDNPDVLWSSALGYNAGIINPVGNTSQYNGLFNYDKTSGNSMFNVRQRGYTDEYSINFGGNLMNMVYWGIGFGITDLELREEANYDEELTNARIPADRRPSNAVKNGNGWYNLRNHRNISGTGFSLKIGAIVKPINELRLGIALHTPTYYSITDRYYAAIDYSYDSNFGENYCETPGAYYDWQLNSPWRMIISAAGVIGGRFIVSADYEYEAYQNMKSKNGVGDLYKGYTDDIKYYFKPSNTFRLGMEFRATPQFSVRGGFAYTSSAVKDEVNRGEEYIYTSGTNPAYTFDTSTRYITLGLGYRIGGFYADLAYVNKFRESTYHPFTSFPEGSDWCYGPSADFNTTDNNIVLSVGYKF